LAPLTRLTLPLLVLLACDRSEPQPAATSATPAATSAKAPSKPQIKDTMTAPWDAASVSKLIPQPGERVGKTPTPLKRDPAIDAAMTRLGEVVDRYAADPDNPWAIGHGLLARGEGFKLRDGRDAIDALFSDYAEPFSVGASSAGEGTLVRFPSKVGDVRVEPHSGQILKVLTEIGVSPDRVVTVAGNPHPVADLYRGTLVSSYLDPQRNHSSFSSTDDIAWSLQGLTAWSPPGLAWTATDGTSMKMRDLGTFGATVLIKESQFMFAAMQAGAEFDKRGQGIFKYTCGGAHLLQGTAFAMKRGFGTQLAQKGLLGQIPLMFYRLPIELKIYDAAMKQAPEHALLLLVQRLKFTGHFLESMHKMAAMGMYRPSQAQQATLNGAAQHVALVVRALDQQGAFDGAEEIRKTDEQLYLDIVGDSAHALRGLQLATGEGSVRY